MSNQYKSILKATSIFGGTQILQIIITFVRSKFVALFIGANGMGISSMYNSTVTLFVTVFGLGIGTSIVRDMSRAYDEDDKIKLALISGVFKRLIFTLAIVGAIVMVCLSKFLSIWTFGSSNYTYEFMALSLMMLFNLLQNGNISLLVGTRNIKATALCSLWGSVISLITSVPLFYFFGINGIVPGFVISSFANYLITHHYCSKIKMVQLSINFSDMKKYSGSIIALGIAMVASLLIGNLSRYLTNIAIARIGNISDLGYYNAAISITLQSVSLVFAAMASDYFPRLSAAMKDTDLMNETVRQQTDILFYLTIPILSIMMMASPLIVKILLTDEFIVIEGFMRLICIGMFIKVASYPLGYIAFAKGDRNVYFWLEGIYANFSTLLFSLVLYKFFGLQGLAWSFVLSYILYYIVITFVSTKRYGLHLRKNTISTVVIITICLFLLYAASLVFNSLIYYCISGVWCVCTSVYYLNKLNKATSVIAYLKEKLASKQ